MKALPLIKTTCLISSSFLPKITQRRWLDMFMKFRYNWRNASLYHTGVIDNRNSLERRLTPDFIGVTISLLGYWGCFWWYTFFVTPTFLKKFQAFVALWLSLDTGYRRCDRRCPALLRISSRLGLHSRKRSALQGTTCPFRSNFWQILPWIVWIIRSQNQLHTAKSCPLSHRYDGHPELPRL